MKKCTAVSRPSGNRSLDHSDRLIGKIIVKHPCYFAAAFGSVILVSGYAGAQNQKNTPPPVVLADTGKALETQYATTQAALKAELEKAIPKLDEAKIAAWMQAIQAEEGPEKEAVAKARDVERMQGAEGRLRDLEEQLKLAPKTLADTGGLKPGRRSGGKT